MSVPADATPILGVPREHAPGETRVAITPPVVPALTKLGLRVLVERGAGMAAGFADAAYEERGAILASREDVLVGDVIVRVHGWSPADDDPSPHPDQVLIALADPLGDVDAVRWAVEGKVVAFALDLLPRITRAQAMDALSSQATIVGYKAVLLAAGRLPKLFPMLTTAAGTITPAQTFVIGAGVAGLQAIATARRLGAVVQGYDVRPAAQEDIESLGGRAVLLPLAPGDAEDESGYAKALGPEFYRRQRELMAQVVATSDVVITTASIPGKAAPVLVTADAVAGMARGSMIVDCAADRGGNCELTRRDEVVVSPNGVTVLGPTNLPATVPATASQMYAKNVAAFVALLVTDGAIDLDAGDEIVGATMVTRGGEIVADRVRGALEEVTDGA
jgi:NAD(P) transhydrogenase subunit alpha